MQVPPLMIVQHWGEEWVPVFTRDQQAQRDEPQEPFSDAYLSGLPMRKRRCVRESRPPATLHGMITGMCIQCHYGVDDTLFKLLPFYHLKNETITLYEKVLNTNL